ncbi:TetR/AcrR family transcriptional regulator [Saccharopolyspora erythraea]|uniref:TetR/AcrR family transcriptional regulator n=1 Tax=Saccharopolyspora erythraea TaxID=1836 RepID=UPI001BAA88C4|nr:TetR/AcrR family transcriptional regulator [Saccharopolyspora erythraea]QUH05607.1 TetR/AcrR family transcriptional regulator [Saccharopolyspora erythraea]
MVTDHRKLPRRRGEALNAAILQATLDELSEVGYAGLTMERVAERARTGKASVYRRWPSRMELALDAVYHVLPDPSSPPDTGTLRGDLLALLRHSAETLAGPAGEALRGLLSDVLTDPSRTAELRQHSHGAGRRAVAEVARRAVERGEIPAEAVTPRRTEVAHAMLRQHFLFQGVPIPDKVIVEIVDEVLVPLFRA